MCDLMGHISKIKVAYVKRRCKLIRLLLFSKVSAGEPDPLCDQEVFLRPGRVAAPVSRPRVSLIVSKSQSCKLSRMNHRKT